LGGIFAFILHPISETNAQQEDYLFDDGNEDDYLEDEIFDDEVYPEEFDEEVEEVVRI
jgi:hypothetical protein